MRFSIAGTFASLSLIAAAAACGSTEGDVDVGADGADSGGTTGTDAPGADLASDLDGDLGTDSSTGANGSDLGVDGAGTGGTSLGGAGPVCEAAESAAETTPVFLGFAFDVSGSMGKLDRPNWWHDPVAKWTPVVTATAAFFESPSSAGLQASLALFPAAEDSCDDGTYEEPTVPMTELPSTAFAAEFSSYEEEVGTPLAGGDWRGGTPTYAATRGVSQYLASLREETPDGKFAIVLVTDGLPQSCSEGLPEVVTLVEDLAADGIATYVIGIENPTTPPADLPDGWAD